MGCPPMRSLGGMRGSTAARWALLLSLLALGGCGGGSGGSSAPSIPPVSAPSPAPPSTPPASYSANISWFAPAIRLNGLPIDNLAGYRLYYGTSYLNLPQTSIEINNPSAVTATVTGLAGGTWYFAVTAVDGNGYESSFSNIVSRTFP